MSDHKSPPLDWDENPDALPYLDKNDNLVIPIDAPRKYRWWQGGQSIKETEAELRNKQKDERS
jgi:hypothetical protein